MTALAALSRLDDGTATAGDRLIADLFDAHSSVDWHARVVEFPPAGFCLVCGEPSGDMPECDGCAIEHDFQMRRAEDQ